MQASILEANARRRRLMDPPNAVHDRPLEMLNGRTVPSRVIYIEKRRVSPQPVDTRETLLTKNRHACTAIFRGEPIPTKLVTFDMILRQVASHFNVSLADILSHRRTKNVTWPRQIACYLAKHHTQLTLPQLGRRVGGRDHTTIMSAIRVTERRMEKIPSFAENVEAIKRKLLVS